MVKVNCDSVEVVNPPRADLAGGIGRPSSLRCRHDGVEHRVVDNQLAAPVEQVTQCGPAGGSLEGVLLLDQLPGQISSRLSEAVALTGKGLLIDEMPFARRDPLLVRD